MMVHGLAATLLNLKPSPGNSTPSSLFLNGNLTDVWSSAGVNGTVDPSVSPIARMTGFDLGFFVSGVFAWTATLLSVYLIWQHFSHYTMPTYQRHIVRILCMVPIYSLTAWLTYRYLDWGTYFDLVRSCFEAAVIYEFFSLFLSYLGDTEEEHVRAVQSKSSVRIPFPFCCLACYPAENASFFLRDIKLTVTQYVIIRPLTMGLAIVLHVQGLLRPESLSPQYANFWLIGINLISVSVALLGLIIFYQVIARDIAEYQPLNKFLSVKFVVVMTFWQSIVLGLLAYFNCIPSSQYWSKESTASDIQSLLICVEMFVASLWHMSNRCFGYGNFVEDGSRKPLPLMYAVQDAFHPLDTLREMYRAVQHFMARLFLWWYRREPVAQDDLTMSDMSSVVSTINVMHHRDRMTMEQSFNLTLH